MNGHESGMSFPASLYFFLYFLYKDYLIVYLGMKVV